MLRQDQRPRLDFMYAEKRRRPENISAAEGRPRLPDGRTERHAGPGFQPMQHESL